MSYSHLLVAVAPTPESHELLRKAVEIAEPAGARIISDRCSGWAELQQ